MHAQCLLQRKGRLSLPYKIRIYTDFLKTKHFHFENGYSQT